MRLRCHPPHQLSVKTDGELTRRRVVCVLGVGGSEGVTTHAARSDPHVALTHTWPAGKGACSNVSPQNLAKQFPVRSPNHPKAVETRPEK